MTPTEAERTGTEESEVLIVGLGNPGGDYATHRHNIGFQVVDALAGAHGLTFERRKDARARVAEGALAGHPSLVAKPQTFMNLSGRTVARLSQAYRLPPERILVVYDDLDLPLGRLRLRPGGGAGGHKGIKSIIDALGSGSFPRLRVGIGRPPGTVDPADYVLQPFDEEQIPILDEVIPRAVAAIECWLAEGITPAMDQFNRPLRELEGKDVQIELDPQERHS